MPPPERPRLQLDESVFGSCVLLLSDYTHAVRHEPRTRRLIRGAMAFGAFACVAGIALMNTRHSASGLAVFAMGILGLSAYNAPEHIAQRWFGKTPREARHVRYTVSPHGLIVVSDASRSQYAWADLHGFVQVPEALLVWVDSKFFLVVPRRAFDSESLPRVIERLEREVGEPPPRPRFWSWLLLCIALGAIGLYAWNRLSPR